MAAVILGGNLIVVAQVLLLQIVENDPCVYNVAM